MTGFLNPYGFVSVPDRKSLPSELADTEPAGHGQYRDDLWVGGIPITITTITPLLIPDHSDAARNDTGVGPTPTLPVRVDDDGRPMLSGSSLKGMLRSAYEAITNSRLGVFTDNDLPLAIRGTATRDVAENLRPAVVEKRDDDTAQVRWVRKLIPIGRGSNGPDPNPAVWVPREILGDLADCADVEAWIHLLEHRRKFRLWRASDISEPGRLPARPSRVSTGSSMQYLHHPAVRVRGKLLRTGSSFPPGGRRKHDERLVVTDVSAGPAKVSHGKARVGRELIDRWRAVIDSFARAHANEPQKDRERNYGTYVWAPERWRDLRVGRTLHVEITGNGDVVGLFPAMIGRKPFAGTPAASLPTDHQPAPSLKKLSPADRVFGWARQGSDDGEAAYRGHLRIDPGDEQSRPGKEYVRLLNNALPLATLNGPNPAQFLFYLADQDGNPLEGAAKHPDQGYPAGPGALESRRLRGRKVYVTHADVVDGTPNAATYWDPSPDVIDPLSSRKPVQVNGHDRYREYEAPRDYKKNVTTTISEWVKPGATFRFTLRVDNVTGTELGALLWLLDLPDRAYHKLGLGKPLGFGTVRVEANLAQARLYTSDTLRNRYRSLELTPQAEPSERLLTLRKNYDELLREHMPTVREEFLAAAIGYSGASVHYPRAGTQPDAKSYEWWVTNDKEGNRHALPLLRKDKPPLLPDYSSPNVSIEGASSPPPKRRRATRPQGPPQD